MSNIDPYATTNALARGYQFAGQMQEDKARRTAGNALATGDTQGAIGALGEVGALGDISTLQSAQASREASKRTLNTEQQEQVREFMLRGARAIRAAPAEAREQTYQQLRPTLAQMYPPDVLAQMDSGKKDDATLDSLIAALGGEARNAPSGYRYKPDGTLEAIPGGPEAPENQRWQVTPYGLIPPAGWQPPAGQQPQGQSQGEIVRELPPGVVPFNQPPAAPAAAGGERSQTPRVSFRSSGEARQVVSQMVPGVTVTNADRTPADTARIRAQGYRPSNTSFHLRGQALDLTPPRGMTMAQLEAKMRQAGFRVLNEGHHIHVSW